MFIKYEGVLCLIDSKNIICGFILHSNILVSIGIHLHHQVFWLNLKLDHLSILPLHDCKSILTLDSVIKSDNKYQSLGLL